jgi:hypothetical protein
MRRLKEFSLGLRSETLLSVNSWKEHGDKLKEKHCLAVRISLGNRKDPNYKIITENIVNKCKIIS